MSDREFNLYRKLIYSRAGICLSPPKKALLEARLGRRLRELGLESFLAYYRYVIEDTSESELVQLLDRFRPMKLIFFGNPGNLIFSKKQSYPIG